MLQAGAQFGKGKAAFVGVATGRPDIDADRHALFENHPRDGRQRPDAIVGMNPGPAKFLFVSVKTFDMAAKWTGGLFEPDVQFACGCHGNSPSVTGHYTMNNRPTPSTVQSNGGKSWLRSRNFIYWTT
jgi:hypothetical protein